MGRSRRSAADAGTRFERSMADYLSAVLGDDAIDRQVTCGSKDKGDIRGLYLMGKGVAFECKEYRGELHLPQWLKEAETERANKGAAYGVVCAKRKGTADPADQYVCMTAETFAAMLAGGPDNLEVYAWPRS